MAAHEHLSPNEFPDLRGRLESFDPGTSCGESAYGQCERVSHSLRDHLGEGEPVTVHGLDRSWLEEPTAEVEPWDEDPRYTAGAHTALVVGDAVVDYTARQFRKSADYPLIEPVDSFRSRWLDTVNMDDATRRTREVGS
jgi:hypothetical protein